MYQGLIKNNQIYNLPFESFNWSNPNSIGAFSSPLKLTMGVSRFDNDGSLNFVGTKGGYWTSSTTDEWSGALVFDNTVAEVHSFYVRATAYSVRCIKN